MRVKSRQEKETLRRLLADYGDGLMDHHSEILRARLLAGAPMRKIAEHRGLHRATAYKRLREAAEALLELAPGEDPAHQFFAASDGLRASQSAESGEGASAHSPAQSEPGVAGPDGSTAV